ncbi:Hypothetical predicted protein [Lynx pardinus]|uniref:Uncharacterized protein n=1 Tax=Lynx pardinus TaxID=191816 RepID=A0A485MNW8_LYNPA|nr:Hypothetical predicted protein [Lynx pardinus]
MARTRRAQAVPSSQRLAGWRGPPRPPRVAAVVALRPQWTSMGAHRPASLERWGLATILGGSSEPAVEAPIMLAMRLPILAGWIDMCPPCEPSFRSKIHRYLGSPHEQSFPET